jgi:GDP-D-mannose dehydratase
LKINLNENRTLTQKRAAPHRGENFVTRKITLGITAIMAGKQECLSMGNLDAQRDWGPVGLCA